MSDKIKEEIIELIENDKELREGIKNKIEEKSENNDNIEEKSSISRRNFLKKTGVGAASLGLAGLIPSAAGLNMKSDQSFNFNRDFSIDTQGNLDVSQVNTERLSIGGEGPVNSLSDIGGSTVTRDMGTDTRALAKLYSIPDGGYKGVVFRNSNSYSDPSDAGTVLQSLVNDIESNFARYSKGGVGRIYVGPGTYKFSSQVTVSEFGVGIMGDGTYQGNKFPVGAKFIDNGVGKGNALLYVDQAKGFQCIGITLGWDGGDADGIYLNNTDAAYLRDIEMDEDMSSDARGLHVNGSYNSFLFDSAIVQAKFEQNTNVGKNVNQWRISNCDFNSANADVSPVQMCDGGNWVQHCRINSDLENGSLNSEVPTLSSDPDHPFQRTHFIFCQFLGNGGDPIIESGAAKNSFRNCWITGGDGPAFRDLRRTKVRDCFIATGSEFYKPSKSGQNRVLITGNYFKSCCGESGEAVIDMDISDASNSNVLISNNNFIQGPADYNYDIRIGKNAFTHGTVIGNDLSGKGMLKETGWGGAVQGGKAPKIVENNGYNPVGYERNTPSLPGATGRSNSVLNNNSQSASIVLEGGNKPYDPTIVESDGSTENDLTGSPPVISVPPLGEVYFRSNLPDSWTWRWS